MKITLTLVAMYCCIVAVAQTLPPKELHFNHLFVEDGLVEGHVRKTLQDKEGYLWMCTVNGLVRYDGYAPKTYHLPSDGKHRFGITDLCETKKGELWVATAFQGIYQYDRYNDRFIHYEHDENNAFSISEGRVNEMLSDKHDNIWLTIWNNEKQINVINCLNLITKKFRHFGLKEKGKQYISSKRLFSLIADNRGNTWCGSENGLQEFDYNNDRFIPHFANTDSLNQNVFEVLCADISQPNVLWASVVSGRKKKSFGLWQYNTEKKKIKNFRHTPGNPSSLANDTIFQIQTDSKRRTLILTKGGLSIFNPFTESFTNYFPGSKANATGNAVYECKEDRAGNYWCITSGGLIYLNAKSQKFVSYAEPKTQVDESGKIPYNLFIDGTGNPWFTVGSAGVQWIDKHRSKFTLFKNDPADPHFFPGAHLNGCAEARDGSIWMATERGLYHFKPGINTFTLIKLEDNIPSNNPILSVLVDKNGLVWCGAAGNTLKGLYCYNPKTKKIRNYSSKENDSASLSYDRVQAIYEDHAGVLWVGTWGGGLCRFNKEADDFTRYPYIVNFVNTPNHNKLDDDQVSAIYEDKNHTLWVSTNQGSMNKLDRKTGIFTSLQTKLIQSTSVTPMFEDTKNRFWLGTFHGGLLLFDRKTNTGKKILENDGLLSESIWGILGDDYGNLWIKSPRGISIYTPETKTIRNFTDDILNEENDFYGSFKTSSGLFIFSSKYGFVTLNPDDFKLDTITPIVHIETIIFTKPQATNTQTDSTIYRYGKNNISFKHNENKITFNYVGLLYQNPARVQYKYKLEGYDKGWVDAGTQRTVTYTNLAPGSYTFRVTAANSDGVWCSKPDTITFTISPPWWQTWCSEPGLYLLLPA